MKLEIISPKGTVYAGEVESVSLPGEGGSFDILPKHAPLIASLKAGELLYRSNGSVDKLAISGGFVEVKEDHLSVCIE